MFRRDRIGRRGEGVILYIKECIEAYKIRKGSRLRQSCFLIQDSFLTQHMLEPTMGENV